MGEISAVLEEIEIMAAEGKNTELIAGKMSIIEQLWKNVVEEINTLLPKLTT
jgi:hypothetical protein